MMRNLPLILRPQAEYEDPLIRQQAQSLLLYLAITFVLTIFIALVVSILYVQSFSESKVIAPTLTQVIAFSSPFSIAILFYFVRSGYYRVGATGIVLLALLYLSTFYNSTVNTVSVLAFTLPIIAAGLLLGWRVTFAIYVGSTLFAISPTLLVPGEPLYGDLLVLALLLLIVTILVIIFGSNLQTTAVNLIKQLAGLEKIVDHTITVSRDSNESQAAIRAMNILRDQPGHTLVRIYPVEADEVVQRIQSSLNLAQVNIDTDITSSPQSGLSEVIRTKTPLVIRRSADPLLRQHLLTGSSVALAVPVFDHEGNVIAVLDIQSEDKTDFSVAEVKTAQLVATQYGQSIEQLRTVNGLRRDLIEQDELITRQRQRLLEYERAERQVTTETWRDYLQQQGVEYLGYDMPDLVADPVESITMTDEIQAAIQTGDIKVEMDGKQQIVSVPISLRGQTLGAMSFQVPAGSQVIGARQQELIRNVVQRLSLALENKRLFEQSQSQAKRESKANEVGSLLLSSTDINTVLNLAAENFNGALGAIQTQIRLQPDIEDIVGGESQS